MVSQFIALKHKFDTVYVLQQQFVSKHLTYASPSIQ